MDFKEYEEAYPNYCRTCNGQGMHIKISPDPERQLKAIVEEVNIRIKITQQEIFFIGEMLTLARALLKEEKIKFEDWINENFDFGVHTAINFCNVYTACSGYLPLIQHVKPSILYKISSKRFPKDLKDLLVFSKVLKEINNTELVEIYEEYQEKGFDAVKSKLEQKSYRSLINVQIAPFLDNLHKTQHHIECVKEKIQRDSYNYYPTRLQNSTTPIATEIERIIVKTIDDCSKILAAAASAVHEKLSHRKINETSSVNLPADPGVPPSSDCVMEMQGDKIIVSPVTNDQIPEKLATAKDDTNGEPVIGEASSANLPTDPVIQPSQNGTIEKEGDKGIVSPVSTEQVTEQLAAENSDTNEEPVE